MYDLVSYKELYMAVGVYTESPLIFVILFSSIFIVVYYLVYCKESFIWLWVFVFNL